MKYMLIVVVCCVLLLGSVGVFVQDVVVVCVISLVFEVVVFVDVVRFVVVCRMVDYVFFIGIYVWLMNGKMSGLMDQMMDMVGKMLLCQLVVMGGILQDKVSKFGDGMLKEVMVIYDLNYQEWFQLILCVMIDELVFLMIQFELVVCDGLIQVYVWCFNVQQFDEFNCFFVMLIGVVYVVDFFVIFMDLEVMLKMLEIMLVMIKEMLGMMVRMKEVMVSLLLLWEFGDLMVVECWKLVNLFGVSEEELSCQKSVGWGMMK